MIILGIETSCDETAISIIETRGKGTDIECRVVCSLIHSQAHLHSEFGGVFPTLAKREHGKNIMPLLSKALQELETFITQNKKNHPNITIEKEHYDDTISTFKKDFENHDQELYSAILSADFLNNIPHIDRIAVTEGPGLEPTLWVGINFARFLSNLWSVPLIPVNHMEGHVVASLLPKDTISGTWQKLTKFSTPSIALLISGGHTEIVEIEKIGKYKIIGETKDDAVGEAFDKVARLLELPYPGGPQISRMANLAEEEHLPKTLTLPRPMINSGDLSFSFSGLKTAVLYAIREHITLHKNIDDTFRKMISLEFETAIRDVFNKKIRLAIENTGARSLIVGGGVSANTRLRGLFENISKEYGIELYLPTIHTSGDNALMITLAGAIHDNHKHTDDFKAQGTMKL